MKAQEPVNPYLPPLARTATDDGGSLPDGREAAILRAFELLKSGKDQWAVVNDLRSSGLPPDDAKRESYPVFDEAKRRLSRLQFLPRVAALMLIVSGVVIPLGLLWAGAGYLVVSSIPIVAGLAILFKLPNPKRVRPDLMFGPAAKGSH